MSPDKEFSPNDAVAHQIGLRFVSDLPVTGIIAIDVVKHAAMFGDELIVLQQGKIAASAPQKTC